MFMFTTIEDFKSEWEAESGNTRKILAALTDKSLTQAVVEQHRTLGRMAWHIVQSIVEMSGKTGLKVDGPSEHAPVPQSAQAILSAYDKVTASFLEQIQSNWQDDTLAVADNMYGQDWQRGLTLYIVLKHEMHHRGQMTILMRQAGLVVPGIYGPAKEEWTQMSMPEPEI